jgi:hypothetical protein
VRALPPWAWVMVAAAAMVGRAPVYFTAPSFWAEEGSLFHAYAFMHRWDETLASTPSGYYLFYANLVALVAARAPVVIAPLVTKILALVIQLVPVALIATSEAPLWRSPSRRALGIAAVLFGSLSGEIWLATINSQFYLTLIAILVLIEPPPSGRRAAVSLALLALAGLTGPVASFVVPLFAWRAWRTRTRAAIGQALVLAACALVQIAMVARGHGGTGAAARLQGFGFGTFGAIVWMKAIILPTLGATAAEGFSYALGQAVHGRLDSPLAITLGVEMVILAAVALVWLARGAGSWLGTLLGGAWALVTSLSIVFAVEEKWTLLSHADSASRYFYVPGVVLLLLLLENACAGDGARVRRAVCGVLLAAGLVGGAARWRSSIRYRPSWPVWRTEVAAWQADATHALAIWPPPWQMRLIPPSPR